MKYTLDEFKNVWNGNSANDILNQFYYEHIELQKAFERIANLQIDKSQSTNNWNELEKWLKEYMRKNEKWYTNELSTYDKQYYGDTYYTTNAVLMTILDKMKEIKNGDDE